MDETDTTAESATEGASRPGARLCLLQDALGRIEACAGRRCPFWEEEVEVGCVIEPISAHLYHEPHLAAHLLSLRERLDHLRHGRQADDTWVLFHRLLNEEQAAESA